ncbi:MAG: DUF2199 domain-containing protein [Beijerinckiaceae bacterium]
MTPPRTAAHRLLPMIDLRNDPRWMRLNDPLFRAGGFTGGQFDLDIDRPAVWTGGEPVRGDDEFDPNNFLADDFCIIDDKHFFLRGVIELPILGGGGRTLAYAIWAEVSRATFGAYFKSLEDPSAAAPVMIGTFANQINGFAATLGQPCTVRARPGAFRPLVTLNDGNHPLAQAQLRGVTLDRLLELYAAAGIDLRPALAVTH